MFIPLNQGCEAEGSTRVAGEPPRCVTGVDSTTERAPHYHDANDWARLPDSETPSVNLLIDWFRVSIPRGDMSKLLPLVDAEWGEHEFRTWGLWRYDRSYAWDNGVQLQFQSSEYRDRNMTAGMVTLEIPGHVLHERPLAENARFLKKLKLHIPASRCGRIDVKAQDLERVITPHELFRLVYEEDWSRKPMLVVKGQSRKLRRVPLKRDFTGFERISYRCDCKTHDGCQYDQVMFGKPGNQGSGKCLVVYDKWLESAGKIVSVDWELRLFDRRAAQFFDRLADTPTDEWGQCIASAITASIDFRHRDQLAAKNVNRCKRYEFWVDLCERIGSPDATTIALAVDEKTVAKGLTFVGTQAMGTLQMCRVALGRQGFVDWLLDEVGKEDRLSKRHRDAIAEWRAYAVDHPDFGMMDVHDFFAERELELDPDFEPPDGE